MPGRRHRDRRRGLRPPGHGVDEEAGILAYDELVIDTLLSNLDVELAPPESMIVPEFPDPRRILGPIAVGRPGDYRGRDR